jgi:cytochrome c556
MTAPLVIDVAEKRRGLMNSTKKPFLVIATVLFTVMTISVNPAGTQAESAKPMALRGVMDKLGRDMQAITGAISKEEWAVVAELAPKIANHAEPPVAEKMRILAWLGTDAGKFRSHDGQTHESATVMGDAAKSGDGLAVISAFSKVQQSCLICHQSFRKSFLEHFYENR